MPSPFAAVTHRLSIELVILRTVCELVILFIVCLFLRFYMAHGNKAKEMIL
jgi:hypothetical protein